MLTLVLLASLSADSIPPCALEVVRVRVVDVDTIKGDVILPLDHVAANQTIRDSGFDGWEASKSRNSKLFADFTEAQWNEELAKGVAAKQALEKLSFGGVWYYVPAKDWKREYSRIGGKLILRTGSGKIVVVSEWAAENGHVRK